MDGNSIDLAVTSLLIRARRYRVLAASTGEADIAREFEHLARLFEAEASRGLGETVRLH